MTQSGQRKLGGFGALFFLATLGGIAFYVQGQSIPSERDLERTAVTVLPDAVEEDTVQPLPMPWKDRLDLSAAELVPIQAADASTPAPASTALPTVTAETATAATPVARTPKVIPAQARYVQELHDGHRILLTLDPVLQDSMLTIFRNREVPYAGAVMLDLEDNAVLVLVGHSTADPEVDPLEVVGTAWAPAASTFKLVTTAALLDGEAVTPTSKVCFSGGGLHGITDQELEDVPGRDTQCETLASAVAHSYNLVIGKLALRHLDQDHLADMARTLFFETKIPFEFNVEKSPAHIPATPIDRAKVAAGFWNVDQSPIHAALQASIFARGGLAQPPHVIAQVVGPDGTDLTPVTPPAQRVLSRDVAHAIAEMMMATTTEGTARKGFYDDRGTPYIPGVAVAGKTGSLTGKRAPYLNYNWFIGFAPAERPEIAFAVLLANEPKWRIKAHYAARRMVELYLERREAIALARHARVTTDGVIVPVRDASGAIVKPGQAPAPNEAVATVAETKPLPPPPEGQTVAESDAGLPPLPPPPGAVPKPPVASTNATHSSAP